MSDELITLVLNEVRSIAGAVTDLRDEVGGLRGEFGGLRHEVGALRDEFGGLRHEVGALRDEFGGLRHEVGALRDEFGGLRHEVGALRDEVGSLRTRLGNLSTELAGIRADIMGRIDRLQERLESVRDDVFVNLGQAQRGEQIALNVREETRNEQKEFRLLAEQVSGLQRAIFRINTRLDQLDKPGQ